MEINLEFANFKFVLKGILSQTRLGWELFCFFQKSLPGVLAHYNDNSVFKLRGVLDGMPFFFAKISKFRNSASSSKRNRNQNFGKLKLVIFNRRGSKKGVLKLNSCARKSGTEKIFFHYF